MISIDPEIVVDFEAFAFLFFSLLFVDREIETETEEIPP